MSQRHVLEGLQLLYQRVDQEHNQGQAEWNKQLLLQRELSHRLIELDQQRQAISKAIEVITRG